MLKASPRVQTSAGCAIVELDGMPRSLPWPRVSGGGGVLQPLGRVGKCGDPKLHFPPGYRGDRMRNTGSTNGPL
jgi:hypothetical protein